MNQITLQVNVALSPETIAALEELAYAVMRALRPIAAAPRGGPEGLPDAPAAIPAAAAAPAPLGGGADGMLAEVDDDEDLAPEGEKGASAAEMIPPAETWTEERISAMASLRAMGEKWPLIISHLNAMPGRKIASEAAAQVKYSSLKREGKLPAVRVDVSVARMLEEHAAKNADVAATDWQAIADWARFNKVDIEGMVQAAALKKINAARAQFELPPFVVTRAFGPVDALPHPHEGGKLLAAVKEAPKFKRRAA